MTRLGCILLSAANLFGHWVDFQPRVLPFSILLNNLYVDTTLLTKYRHNASHISIERLGVPALAILGGSLGCYTAPWLHGALRSLPMVFKFEAWAFFAPVFFLLLGPTIRFLAAKFLGERYRRITSSFIKANEKWSPLTPELPWVADLLERSWEEGWRDNFKWFYISGIIEKWSSTTVPRIAVAAFLCVSAPNIGFRLLDFVVDPIIATLTRN